MKCTIDEQETCDVEKRGHTGCFYCEADEMFEELGYEDLSNSSESGFGCLYLYGKDGKRIGFYSNKTLAIYNYIDGYEEITMPELKAIYKKCEELGWI